MLLQCLIILSLFLHFLVNEDGFLETEGGCIKALSGQRFVGLEFFEPSIGGYEVKLRGAEWL